MLVSRRQPCRASAAGRRPDPPDRLRLGGQLGGLDVPTLVPAAASGRPGCPAAVTATSRSRSLPAHDRSSIIRSAHSPVSSSRPSSTSSPPPTYVTTAACRRTTRERAEQPAGAERHQHERHPETEAVGQREERAAARAGRGQRQRLHRAERRADARRPAEPEDHAEQRRAGQPGRRQPVDPQPRAAAPAARPRNASPSRTTTTPSTRCSSSLVPDQQPAEPAEEHPVRDEDRGEAEHEQHRAGHHPARGRPGSAPSCRRPAGRAVSVPDRPVTYDR